MIQVKFNGRRMIPDRPVLGNQDDNGCQQVCFQLPEIFEGQTAYVCYRKPDLSTGMALLAEGVWTVERGLTRLPGQLTVYLRLTDGTGKVWNSDPFPFQVGELYDLDETGTPAADPTALEAAVAVISGYAAQAQQAAQALAAPQVQAVTLEAGQSATAQWDLTGSQPVLCLGLPRGAQGPQGSRGDTGQTGAQGPQGVQGPQGLQGPKGDKGDTGDTGPQGPQGEKGDTGATGPQGPQGDKGDKGDTGATGPQGPQGPKGDPGETGAGFQVLGYYQQAGELYQVEQPTPGDAYGVGAQAPYDIYIWDGVGLDWVNNGPLQGARGETGPQGPQGEKGDTGEAGPQGLQGETGPQGPKGDKGDTGDTGPQGPKGDTGDQGEPGPNALSAATAAQLSGLIKGQDGYVAAAQAGVDYALPAQRRTLTLAAEDWTQAQGLYTQTLTVAGLSQGDAPLADILQTGDEAVDQVMRRDWGGVLRMETGDQTLTAYAARLPQGDISFQLVSVG